MPPAGVATLCSSAPARQRPSRDFHRLKLGIDLIPSFSGVRIMQGGRVSPSSLSRFRTVREGEDAT